MKKNADGYPIPRKAYVLPDKYSESCYIIQVFHTKDILAEFPHLLRFEQDIPIVPDSDALLAALSLLRPFEKGFRRAFGSSPSLRIGKHNIVVKQFRGFDI